jgi:uncharacterized protein
MLPLIERNQPAIAELCKQHGVDRLYVFGSVLRPDYRPGLSDLDFLVDFQPMSPVRIPSSLARSQPQGSKSMARDPAA